MYGLVDPITKLVRYIGLSTRLLKRQKEHARRRDNRWINELRRLNLCFEIAVLETLEDPKKLPEAERWWIAYGRLCEWPLTNRTNGGETASKDAHLRPRKVKNKAKIQRLLVAQYLKAAPSLKYLRTFVRPEPRDEIDIYYDCTKQFEALPDHFDRAQLFKDVALCAEVPVEIAAALYEQWLRHFHYGDLRLPNMRSFVLQSNGIIRELAALAAKPRLRPPVVKFINEDGAVLPNPHPGRIRRKPQKLTLTPLGRTCFVRCAV